MGTRPEQADIDALVPARLREREEAQGQAADAVLEARVERYSASSQGAPAPGAGHRPTHRAWAAAGWGEARRAVPSTFDAITLAVVASVRRRDTPTTSS